MQTGKKKLLWFEGMQRNKKHQTIHKILHRCVTVTQERAFHPTMSIYHLLTNSWKNTHDNLSERAQYMEVRTPVFRRHLSNIARHLQSLIGESMHMLRSDE